MRFFIIFLFFYAAVSTILIDNLHPKKDINGNLMDIHDGNILQIPNDPYFYWVGMGYGSCQNPSWGCFGVFGLSDCGFQANHSINLYKSLDLMEWEFMGDILPQGMRPEGVYFRPKVLYDDRTQRFILWVNIVNQWLVHLPNYLDSDLLVATSSSIAGPYTITTFQVKTQHSNPGDFTIYAENGIGYLIYDSFNTNHKVAIEILTSDFTDVDQTKDSLIVSDSNNEAPIFFKRNGWYYLLYGQCCCFCRTGSNSVVKMSKSPLGPWIDTNVDIDPYSGSFFGGSSITQGQESFAFSIPSSNIDNNYWVFVSDRWGSASDGMKGHDLQYWGLLQFEDDKEIPTIKVLQWEDQWQLEI